MVRKQSRNLVGIGLAVLLCVLGLGVQLSAQVISGDLVGTVYDKTGAVVPNAAIEALNTGTGVKYTAQGTESGEYRFNNLPIGTYKVSAMAPNFATTTISSFKIELNKAVTLPITLEVKGAVTSIEVSGTAAALDTTTSTVASSFDARLNQDLPSAAITGGVNNLSLLSAGVASSGGIGAGSGPSVGGQRPRNNNFTIEGIDNNNKSVTGPLVNVPNDAVEEFSLLQNQYSPEFGHSSGGQFNTIVKSGTNNYHGAAYIYSQNRNFNAVDVSLKNQGILSNPRYDNNRIGGDFGGPIIRNKLFFFGAVEYNPIGQASVSSSALCSPTSNGYTQLQNIVTANNYNQNNLDVLKTYAVPGTGGACPSVAQKDPAGNPNSKSQIFIQDPTAASGFSGVDVNILPVQAPNFTNNWAAVGSINYDISATDQLRGRYIYNRSVGLDFTPNLPAFFLPTPTKNHLVTISEYHTFNPTLTNEFRVGYNRYTNITDTGNFKFAGLDSFPNLQFFDINLQVGPDPNGPQFTIQNYYSAADALTWTRGHHTLKFGIQGSKYISPQSFTQRSRGDYDYNTLDLYIRDVNPDNLAERSLGDPVYYGDQSAVYLFANDDWRIKPNFTINVGIRYEYTTIPTGERLQALNKDASVPGLIDFSEPRAPKSNWGPRIGFAYSPGKSGRTSIRAGVGISYDVRYDNIGILSLPPQLSGTIDSAQSDVGTVSDFLKNGGILPSPGGIQTFSSIAKQRAATANHIVVNETSPTSYQWTLGVQHSFWRDFTVEVRYVGTRGLFLNTQERINKQAKTSDTLFLPTFFQKPDQATVDGLTTTLAQINAQSSFTPDFRAAGFKSQNLVQFTPNGSSSYHGLATQVTKRMSGGLQFIGSYTFSHTIDDSTADFFSTVLTPRRTQDFQNLSADRANSALDRRHRFTIALLYDLPFFKNGNAFLKNTLGNWEVAPIYTYQTGEWATVQSGRDVNLNGDAAGDRVQFNPAGGPGTGTDVSPLCTSGLPAADCQLGLITCKGTEVVSDPTSPCPLGVNIVSHVVGYSANDPNAQYVRLANGARADVGRNTLLTRPINNFDVTALKRFSFTERYKVEFQAGAYNLLNHPQFVPGSLNNVNSIGYTSSGVTNYLKPGTSVFNKPDQTFASNARTLQLALKFIF